MVNEMPMIRKIVNAEQISLRVFIHTSYIVGFGWSKEKRHQ
jgi:hypothetical protein